MIAAMKTLKARGNNRAFNAIRILVSPRSPRPRGDHDCHESYIREKKRASLVIAARYRSEDVQALFARGARVTRDSA